jgi:hypothetical protein
MTVSYSISGADLAWSLSTALITLGAGFADVAREKDLARLFGGGCARRDRNRGSHGGALARRGKVSASSSGMVEGEEANPSLGMVVRLADAVEPSVRHPAVGTRTSSSEAHVELARTGNCLSERLADRRCFFEPLAGAVVRRTRRESLRLFHGRL